MQLFFSDIFGVTEDSLEDYGTFNISLLTDLPLFVDPFLLFNSQKPHYQQLHSDIIAYLRFLCDKSASGTLNTGLLRAWFYFGEVKQNWLGFTLAGNSGRGLGHDFAAALHQNLGRLFTSFGNETITKGTHLEKLTLIKSGVGRDTISDFTTNLIKGYLLEYTQSFANQYIKKELTKAIPVNRVRFNYSTETWETGYYTLPVYDGDYVLLTPKDILTKDDTWINRNDFLHNFYQIPEAVPNEQLREQINNYLVSILPKTPTRKEMDKAITEVILRFPILLDYYISTKEETGDLAAEKSIEKVSDSKTLYVRQYGGLIRFLAHNTRFYAIAGDTASEAYERIKYLKDVIENKGGWRAFYRRGQPIRKEEDLHIFYRLTWFATPSDVSQEVNDGRGPADFKISRGSGDKTIVEFKLASNPQLKRNLQHQLEIYKQASDAKSGYKVILYFTALELRKVQDILKELKLTADKNIILIDAMSDNKQSASVATSH